MARNGPLLFITVTSVLNKLVRSLIDKRELRIYHLSRESAKALQSDASRARLPRNAPLRRDYLPDLLYSPG